ncbi:MAG TPA: hypothetical protein ENO08_00400 [Candidatus Eisenbacteria bacterium]|uniref:Spi protease inhibitor domain-containing protein n=1 Tax=Eiseniibacteriota bacterium TaxID=2212470 RepID=A0A7V2F2X3_UNCEI|nr:hypothetical protein [Candidatus Eisenbacteria bacterium]
MTISIACALFAFAAVPAAAQIVTPDEARVVATNWIAGVVAATGAWGGSSAASVGEVEEIRRGGRLLGYWCHIEPVGHVVVSFRRELSPVKASSETWDGDPACDADIVDVIKLKIEQEHDYIESRLGPIEAASSSDIEALLERSSRDEWAVLSLLPGEFRSALAASAVLADYQEGMVLLTTNWHQGDPYNLHMPSNTSDCNEFFDYRCAVGCVAIAAAQIMKYWNWPPYGEGSPYDDYYDWTNMPDELTPLSPQPQIAATSVLVAEVGQACQMIYCNHGCASSAVIENMLPAYKDNFRFSQLALIMTRTNYSSESWYGLIQTNINWNSPLHYRIPDHQLVCDGWRIVSTIRQYHMNYGWANYVPDDKECWTPYLGIGSNTWFTLDVMPCAVLSEERMIGYLIPSVSLNNSLSGTYAAEPAFPWRYINMETAGESAVFAAGQMIQSLPGMRVRCTSTTGGSVRFYGSEGLHTRIFARGEWTKGVKITAGGIALYGPAAMVVY